ncbi:unknown protein [Microcystis aeruginosa NIES-843]|uniref:Uncharacterized protein n=1 Tax=Microcystis aeruginosa (strain NIES-843 / IAM M-2473) TaxID=449447 RepID=B0JTL9_MICAN|nr:unknown protein [Microcystis aeruginosa NIES-843]
MSIGYISGEALMQKAKRRINNQFLITGFSIIFREKVPEFSPRSLQWPVLLDFKKV